MWISWQNFILSENNKYLNKNTYFAPACRAPGFKTKKAEELPVTSSLNVGGVMKIAFEVKSIELEPADEIIEM